MALTGADGAAAGKRVLRQPRKKRNAKKKSEIVVNCGLSFLLRVPRIGGDIIIKITLR